MLWEVDLTNGTTVREDSSDPGHWGRFVRQCHSDDLDIIEFRLIDKAGQVKIVDKNADRYYVINEIMAFVNRPTMSRRGICSVRELPEKTRIEWYKLEGGEFITAEITRGIDDHIPEISVARHKPQ
ncbi:hypothetical protein KAR91_49820 [Candidatus Pacearchaeota archaeon]|nr:hypothetical protein [Candidatus Pacearchaeota archaeon]